MWSAGGVEVPVRLRMILGYQVTLRLRHITTDLWTAQELKHDPCSQPL